MIVIPKHDPVRDARTGVTWTLLHGEGHSQCCGPYLAFKKHVALLSDSEIEVLHKVGTCWMAGRLGGGGGRETLACVGTGVAYDVCPIEFQSLTLFPDPFCPLKFRLLLQLSKLWMTKNATNEKHACYFPTFCQCRHTELQMCFNCSLRRDI